MYGFSESTLKDRVELADLLNERLLLGTAVEIGTLRADYAAAFLARWNGKRLVTVDPFVGNLENYDDTCNTPDRSGDREIAYNALKGYRERAIMLRDTSEEAVKLFADGCLDFCYIDGNHALVDQDIKLWWPKMKSGGLFAGHDWDSWHQYVIPALEDFTKREEVAVRLIPASNVSGSWFAWKP